MRKTSETYYVKEDLEGYGVEARDELARQLEKMGFKFYAAQMGGGAEGAKIVEQIIAYLNFNNIWFDIFVGIVANRLDVAFSTIYSWIKKNKSKDKKQPVVEVFIYTPLRGKNNCYFIRLKANKKYSKKKIIKLLKQIKKEQS